MAKLLSKRGIPAMDLDWLGHVCAGQDGIGRWIVSERSLKMAYNMGTRVFLGTCCNMHDYVRIRKPVAGFPLEVHEIKTYAPLFNLDWGAKVMILYDAAAVERRLTAKDRANDHSLDPLLLAQKVRSTQESIHKWERETLVDTLVLDDLPLDHNLRHIESTYLDLRSWFM